MSLLSGALGQAHGQTSNVNVFVLVSPTTYQLDLKAIEGETPTRNFVIKPQSVVQANQSANLAVVTQPVNQIVQSVKIQDSKGFIKELTPLGSNVYSLAGIPLGAYILDVIVDLGNNKKGAYETILVILAQGQKPVPPQQIIQIIKISDTIIFEPDNQTNPDPPFECEPGYKKVGEHCEQIVCPDGTYANENTNDECPEPPPPPCDENTPPGQLCRDEGDDITCDGPAIPIGNECVLPEPETGEGIPEVPEEGDQGDDGNDASGNGDDNDNGNGDDSQPDPDPPEGSGNFFD